MAGTDIHFSSLGLEGPVLTLVVNLSGSLVQVSQPTVSRNGGDLLVNLASTRAPGVGTAALIRRKFELTLTRADLSGTRRVVAMLNGVAAGKIDLSADLG